MCRKALITSIVILSLMMLSKAFAQDEDLVLYLPFSGDVKDATGNGFDGIINGKEDYIDGRFGKAFQFDGATYIKIEDREDSGLDNVPGLTIEVWAKIANHHDNGIVVKLATAGVWWPCSYNLETWSDGLVYFDVGSDAGAYATSEFPLGEWFHIAGVFDGDKGEDRLYINGVLMATNSRVEEVVPDGDLPVYIGCMDPMSLFFFGALDDLVIYSKALTVNEIKRDMNSAIPMSVDNAGKLSITWADIKTVN